MFPRHPVERILSAYEFALEVAARSLGTTNSTDDVYSEGLKVSHVLGISCPEHT